MPTYDYVCAKCGHEFELVQKMTDPPKQRCPKCRGKVERKIGSGAGLIFKGSGFYITDYRSKDYVAKAKAESGTGSGGDTKGDAKPAPKSEAKPEVKKQETKKASGTKKADS